MIFKHASLLIAPFFLASLVSAQTVDFLGMQKWKWGR